MAVDFGPGEGLFAVDPLPADLDVFSLVQDSFDTGGASEDNEAEASGALPVFLELDAGRFDFSELVEGLS